MAAMKASSAEYDVTCCMWRCLMVPTYDVQRLTSQVWDACLHTCFQQASTLDCQQVHCHSPEPWQHWQCLSFVAKTWML